MVPLKYKVSQALVYNYKLNKKSLTIKKSFEDVIFILDSVGKKMK